MSRSKSIFGITGGVWNALNLPRDGANSLAYNSETGLVQPDQDRRRLIRSDSFGQGPKTACLIGPFIQSLFSNPFKGLWFIQ